MKKLFAVLALVAFGLANAQDRSPLGEFRKTFLNQRITLNQNFTSIPSPFLIAWKFVKEKKGVYTVDYGKEVPSTLVGQSGTIVAVFAPSGVLEPPSPQTDDTYVQYAEAVVKLDSGQLIETALYNMKSGHEVHDAFTLASVLEQHKQEAFALGQKLNGKSLYLTRLTRIYDMGLTTATIQSVKAGIGYSEAQINDVPLLTPIPVLETRYSDKLDFSLILLQLPNGQKAQYVPGCVVDELTAKQYACAATSMPSFLTDHEIEAIRKGSVFVGMSEPALYMTVGFPEKTNDSIVGSTQLIYRTMYIYLRDKKVAEVQSHD
jgi:hypothetical protein